MRPGFSFSRIRTARQARGRHLCSFLIVFFIFSQSSWAAETGKKNPAASAAVSPESIQQTFLKGKAFYDAGDADSALRTWQTLDPHLEAYPSVRKVIEYLRARVGASPPKAEIDMTAALEHAAEQVEARRIESQRAKDAVSPKGTGREDWIRDSFERGRLAAEEGDWTTAIENWDKLSSYLDEAAPERKTIEALKRDYYAAEKLREETRRLLAASKSKVKPPKGLVEALEEAKSKLRADIAQAAGDSSAAAKARSEREAWIDATLVRARASYEEGRIEPAIVEWEKALPYLEDEALLREKIASLRENLRSLDEARAQNEGAAADAFSRIRVPLGDRLSAEILRATDILRTREGRVLEEQQKLQRSLAEREEWIAAQFEKGRQFLEAGRIADALAQWEPILPNIEGGEELRSSFDRLRGQLKDIPPPGESAKPAGEPKLKAPAEFTDLVEKATKTVAARRAEFDAHRREIEALSAKRQKDVSIAFEKGKDLYVQGKYWEAADAWKAMLPLIEESPQLEKWIAQFEGTYREYLDSKGAVDRLADERARKYGAPADVLKLLMQAEKDVQSRTAALVAERASMEKGKTEHEAWVRETFQKGKALYQQDRVDLAVAEWEKLVPHLDEASPERALILELRKQRDQAAAAAATVQNLTGSGQGRIPAPSDLKLALESAIDASRAKQREAELERQAVERSISERRSAMLEILQAGRAAFDAGRNEDALAEWKKLQQYVDARSKLDEALKSAEEAFRQQQEAREKLAETKSRGGSRFEPPQELAVAIQQSADRMTASAAAARTEKAGLEKDFTARKLWLDQTYQAGKQHYSEGRLEQAVDEWAKLTPYLPEETGLPERLAQLKAVKEDAARAKREAVEAAARQYQGLRIDPQMETFLADISKDLKTQTIQGQKDRAKAEETLEANRKKTEAILKEGKTLYDAGDLQAALVAWSGLLPYLPETSAARRSLVELRQRFDELKKTERTVQDAQKAAAAGIELPPDFKKLADEIEGRIQAQVQAASTELENARAVRAAREKKVAQSHEVSKSKLWANDIAAAIEGWKAIAPEVSGAPETVQLLQAEWRQAQKAREEAAAATAHATADLAPPADFAKETDAARQKIRADIDLLLGQKTKAEADRAARQAAVQQAFERGKALYWSGKVSEALAEWKTVTASVSDEASVKAFDELQKAAARLAETKASAEASAAAAAGKLPAPAELSKLLALAVEKTNAQTQAAQTEMAKLAEDLASRQARAEEAYQQGVAAAAAGQYDRALAAWRLLTPLLDAQSGLGPMLDGLEKAMMDAAAARETTDAYAAGEFKDIRFAHDDEIKNLVAQAQTRLQAKAADAQKRKADMEKTITDRRAWVDSTFQKGKELFDKGQYAEADEFWTSLTPYLIDGAQTHAMIVEFARVRAAAAEAEKAALEAESHQNDRFPVPAELQGLLAGATEKIKVAQFEARTRRERVEQALSDRRVAIQNAFEKGAAALEKGSVPAALGEWEKMLPLIQDETQVKEALDAVRIAYQQSVEARQAAEAAEKGKDTPLPVPPQLRSTLESVSERMKKEIQSADLQREKMEKALADRRAYVGDIFERGKALYDEGKLREAFDLWRTIGPFTDDEEKLNATLSLAGQAYESFVSAKAASHEAALQQSSKLPAPSDLLAILDDATAKLKQDDFDARNKTFEIEKSISDRREWILSTFKKGQALYVEGRYPEAVAEWNTILPYLEDGLDVKAKLVEIDKNAALAEKSRKILSDSQEKAKIQFQSPKEFSELLLKANEDLKNQMFAASAEKMKAEQTLSERQKWMNQTFSLGRSFYAEGKIGEALAEWSKLKPYLEGQPAIGEMMKTLQTNYEALQQAKKAAVEAAAEDYKGLKLAYSDQMAKVLGQAVEKIDNETLALREKLDKTHETLAERKEWSITTFNKGKVLYEDGRYAEALEQWQRLLPYLEKDSQIKALIEAFQASFKEWSDRSSAIGELEQRSEKPVSLSQPETMTVTFKEAADKMKAQAEAASARAADLEKTLEQRRSWIEFTYQKGRALFDQGRYADAVQEWGVLGPYLSEHPEVRAQIEDAKRSYVQFRKADQILQNVETKKAALPALPADAVLPAGESDEAADQGEEAAVSDEAPAESEPAPAPPPAAKKSGAKPLAGQEAQQLISGEVVSIDAAASTFGLRNVVDGSERSVHYDGATQFDGQTDVSSASLQEGVSVDVRIDSDDRAAYIYVY